MMTPETTADIEQAFVCKVCRDVGIVVGEWYTIAIARRTTGLLATQSLLESMYASIDRRMRG